MRGVLAANEGGVSHTRTGRSIWLPHPGTPERLCGVISLAAKAADSNWLLMMVVYRPKIGRRLGVSHPGNPERLFWG